MEDKNLKNFLIGMISNVVRDIKENIFKVRVENQIKFPEEINVSNLKDIQEVSGKMTVKDLDKAIESLDKIEKKEIKFPEQPKEIEVKNLDKLINKKEIVIPNKFTIENINGIVKILEEIKNKEYPKNPEIKIPDSFKISNLKDIPKTENVNVDKMDNLLEAINGIGSLNRNEKNPIPVRLSDGKYFYKALSEVIERAVNIGGVNNVGLRNTDNERVNPATEDKQDDMLDILNDVHCPLCNALQIIEYYPSIAEDKITDYSRGSIIGSQNVIGTAGFAILSNAVVVQPSGDTQMQVVSDSVEDAAGGTGALEVTITYLPYAWSDTFKTEVVVLNGTTTIDTTATDIYRIESFIVNKANGTGIAVGNITLKSTNGVTLYAQIDAGKNFFERAIHYVRTGYKAVVTGVIIGCSTNGGVIWRLFRSTEDSEGNVIPLGRYSIEVADSTLPYTANMPIVCSNPNGKRMATGLAVLGRNANQKGTGSCRFYDSPI